MLFSGPECLKVNAGWAAELNLGNLQHFSNPPWLV